MSVTLWVTGKPDDSALKIAIFCNPDMFSPVSATKLEEFGVDIGSARSYEVLAAALGSANWSTLKPAIEEPGVRSEEPSATDEGRVRQEAIAFAREVVKRRFRLRSHRFLARDFADWCEFAVDDWFRSIDFNFGMASSAFHAFWYEGPSNNHLKIKDQLLGYVARVVLTEISDLLVEGLVSIVKGKVASALFEILESADRYPEAMELREQLLKPDLVDMDFWMIVMKAEMISTNLMRTNAAREGIVSQEEIESRAPEAHVVVSELSSLLMYESDQRKLSQGFTLFMEERAALDFKPSGQTT
jgi:hypothetical protein